MKFIYLFTFNLKFRDLVALLDVHFLLSVRGFCFVQQILAVLLYILLLSV